MVFHPQQVTFIISFVHKKEKQEVILYLILPVGFISHAHRWVLVRFQARLLWKGQEICLFLKCIFSSLVSEEQ